jgi:hypothetical protein
MSLPDSFKAIRDTPYKIPLTPNEEDTCCSGKHKALKDLFIQQGYEARYRVGSFLWRSIDLPGEVSSVPHDDLSSHVWLEVLIDGEWITIDATWDVGLKNIFHVNEWDGKSNTEIAVKILEVFSPEKSAEIMDGENGDNFSDDSKTDKEFCRTFNEWLEEQRNKIF